MLQIHCFNSLRMHKLTIRLHSLFNYLLIFNFEKKNEGMSTTVNSPFNRKVKTGKE